MNGAPSRPVGPSSSTPKSTAERPGGAGEGGRSGAGPEPGGEGVGGRRGHGRGEPVGLAKMLVDDPPVGEAAPGGERHHVVARGRALIAGGDHVLAEEGGAGR